MDHYMEYLSVPLPEDIQKLKFFGDVALLNEVIDRKIASGVPMPLRKRLEMEKYVMSRWEEEYPYDEAHALKLCMEQIADFTPEELRELRVTDAVEWTYINGKVHFKDSFISNLFATRPHYLARCKDERRRQNREDESRLLNDTMARMKQHGGIKAKLHLKLTTRIDVPEGREGQKVVVQLPLPNGYAQVRNIDIIDCSHRDALFAPVDFPARTVRFEDEPDKPFMIEYSYENHLIYHDLDADKVSAQQPGFCTEEILPHVRFTPFIKMMAQEIVGDEKNPLLKARKIYDYITTKNIYSFMREYMTLPSTIPEYFLAGRKGDCGVQALTFITLCRCVGVPARWQSGLWVSPLDVGMHDWAQFYVAPYGWLFCDPSFGGSAYREGNEERWNFYFGNLDPYRLPANSEFQRQFYVPMQHMRYDPYDNQSCEAEWADAPVDREHIHNTREAVSIEILPD